MSRLSWIKTALSTGVVTKKYPYEHVEVPEGFRGLPVFDPSKCVGCSSCANVCTPDAIKVFDDQAEGYRRVEYHLGRCIFCGRCADVCPLSAITITKEFELAHRAEVKHVIEIKLAKCSQCGKYFTTSRHLKHVSSRLDEGVLENITLCPECRRGSTVNSLIRSLGVFK